MTRLRKMMLEELQRLNYAETTTRHYIRTVEDFARRFNRPPDRLGPRHIREYQAELFQKRKLSPNSVIRHLAALRFFYIKTLKRAWSIAETPYPRSQTSWRRDRLLQRAALLESETRTSPTCALRGAGRRTLCRWHALDQTTLRLLSSRRG